MSKQPKEIKEATPEEVNAVFGDIEQDVSKKPIQDYAGVSKEEMDRVMGPIENWI